MPIEYVTATVIRQRGDGYTAFPTHILQSIDQIEALAVYAYLLSMPEDWTVRPKQVQEHFGIGVTRYRKAMRELRSIGLARDERPRKGRGQKNGRLIIISSYPYEPEAEGMETPCDGESDSLQKNPSTTEESIVTKKRVGQAKPQSTRERSLEDDLSDTSWAD
ncbi:MAG: hypothetical protein ABJL54_00195 [Halioglobus sp.]